MTDVSEFTLPEKVGQLFQVGFHGTEPTEAVRELIVDYDAGGIIYFARNVESPDQTAALSERLQELARDATGHPLLISTDQEGGTVARVPFGTVPPGQMAVGAANDLDLARELGAAIGNQLRSVGINTDLAPVLDVNNDPDNPVIGVRSFGSDPDLVSNLGTAVAAGLESVGVVACGKHFPGHGDTATDSHHELPVVGHDRERLDAIELAPFQATIEDGIDALMTAHVAFPAIAGETPATLSAEVLTGLLREELGYDGLVVTDCMEMDAIVDGVGTAEGAVRTIEAGADQVLVSHTPERQKAAIEAVVDAVESGRIDEARIDESVRRTLRLKRGLDLDDSPSIDEAGDDLVDVSSRVASEAVTLAADEADLLPLGEDERAVVWGFEGGRRSPAEDRRGEDATTRIVDLLKQRGVTVRRHSFEGDASAGVPDLDPDEVLIAPTVNAVAHDPQADAVNAA